MNTKIINYSELPELVKKRLQDKWSSELTRRYIDIGLGLPRPVEIERDTEYRLKHTTFLLSGNLYYQCDPEKI